jgi:hypothetical protein
VRLALAGSGVDHGTVGPGMVRCVEAWIVSRLGLAALGSVLPGKVRLGKARIAARSGLERLD